MPLPSVSVTEMKSISIDGQKSVWVVPPAEIEKRESGMYVLLNNYSQSLKKLVVENNPNVPKEKPRYFSLSLNEGYQELYKLRNEAQARDLRAEADDKCTLFGDVSAPEDGRKKRKKSTSSSRDNLDDCVTFDVVVGDDTYSVTTLRPISSKAKVFIKADEENVAAVLALLRGRTFVGTLYSARDASIPKGVWRRNEALVVNVGKNKTKTVRTIEDAQAMLAVHGDDDQEVWGDHEVDDNQ